MNATREWGRSSRPGGSAKPTPTSGVSHGKKSAEPIAGPGRCLFAVVVPPKDLEPEEARAHVKSALVSAPAHYHLVEHTCGSVAFLGDGTPTADAGPAHSPQVLERPGSVVVLVSPQLNAADIAEAFANVCEAHADPKARAVALKMKLRELSVDERFSFVLLDLATARVFCASTALSSPLALGHAPDGTLLVTCTRSGARAATSWPPRWASGSSTSTSGSHRGEGPKLTHQYGESPGGMAAPLTPERSVSPATDRSRSRSPSACSTMSSGSAMSDLTGAGSVALCHLPAGRFVYGRRYLQPFEFSAFWHSAETNRAGARPAIAETDREDGSGHSGWAGSVDGTPEKFTKKSPGLGSPTWSSPSSGGRMACSSARRYTRTGSRSDNANSWRKKSPVREAREPATDVPAAKPPASAHPVAPVKSAPMAVPRSSSSGSDKNNNTWPGGSRQNRPSPETFMNPFGGGGTPPEEKERQIRNVSTNDSGKWVPRGRWMQDRFGVDGQKFGEGVTIGRAHSARGGASELTRALSFPRAALE